MSELAGFCVRLLWAFDGSEESSRQNTTRFERHLDGFPSFVSQSRDGRLRDLRS